MKKIALKYLCLRGGQLFRRYATAIWLSVWFSHVDDIGSGSNQAVTSQAGPRA